MVGGQHCFKPDSFSSLGLRPGCFEHRIYLPDNFEETKILKQKLGNILQLVLSQQIHPNPVITSSGTPLSVGKPIHCHRAILSRKGGRCNDWFVQSQVLSLRGSFDEGQTPHLHFVGVRVRGFVCETSSSRIFMWMFICMRTYVCTFIRDHARSYTTLHNTLMYDANTSEH